MENTQLLWMAISGPILSALFLWFFFSRKINREKQRYEAITQKYRALSQCNQTIIRATDTQSLFTNICQNTVLYGGMKMAWIGIYNADTQEITIASYYGEGTDYLVGLSISTDPQNPSSQGPTGRAFHENKPFWCQNFQRDPHTVQWHEKAKQFGWASSAALPLHKDGKVVAILSLYSSALNAFDDQTQQLLLEMTSDISYALNNLDAQKALSESQSHLQTIINTEPECVKIVDASGKLIQMNPAGLAMLEADTLSMAQKCPLTDYLLPEHRDAFMSLHHQVMNGESGTLRFEIVGLKGTHRWLETHATPMKDSKGNIVALLGITRDVTEQLQYESELTKRTQAIEQSSNTIIITDYRANIEYVNTAFTHTTGYSFDEAIGRNPRFLKSGKTPPHTYDEMWDALVKQEKWQGEFINRRKDGSEYIYSINVAPVIDENGKTTHYIAIEEDISEQKKTQERIHYLANFDVLTGLPNRIQMNELLTYTLNLSKRNETQFAVMFLDLDHFKEINDTLGHHVGDGLLVAVSQRLVAALRQQDTVARMGGDEFVILLPEIDAEGAAEVAKKLLETIRNPLVVENNTLTITGSIGVSFYPNDGESIDTLTKNADIAMYHAKQKGRNLYSFYREGMEITTAQ